MTKTFLRKSVLAVPLAALALAVSSAYAANVGDVYTVPASLPAANGQLVTYSPTQVKLGTGTPAHTAFKVLYTSKDASGNIQPVTGTVIVPANSNGNVVLYAIGTHGLGQGCSASKQLEQGTDYEAQNILAALKQGYAVLVSDYVGYTNFTPFTNDEDILVTNNVRYIVGASQGRNVLDLFKAASQIPNAGVSASAKVGIWGFSQGGQATGFASQLAETYAPGVNIVGAAAGGVPADFPTVAKYLNGANGSSFLFQAVVGLYNEYGTDIPLDLAISDTGRAALEELKTKCIFEGLLDYENQKIEQYTNADGNWTLDKLLSVRTVKPRLEEQKLGIAYTADNFNWTGKFKFPMYQFHGKADEFIPIGQAFELKQRWCALGNNVTWDTYFSEHIATMTQGATKALAFLADRFAGKAASGTCSNNNAPASTALDNTQPLSVKMTDWPLAATIRVKNLNQDVILPPGSSLNALASAVDTSAGTLNGSITIPDFKQGLKILGIGAQVGLKVAPVGPVTGKVTLDRTGTLKVTGKAPVDITVTSVWGIPFGTCKSASPVNFDLNYSGTVSNLGTGLTFPGTTTFPQIKGCIISAIISALMSGPGQTYTFVVTPPAPVAN